MAIVPVPMLTRLVLCLLIAVAAVGCYPANRPELVELTKVTPGAVSRGDRVAFSGSGFPEGKPAEIVLTGMVYQPGAEPRSVRHRLPGRAASAEQIEWVVSQGLVEAMCGPEAGHVTFQGDVRVWFEAVTASAPRVTGTLRSIKLDVYQPMPAEARGAVEEATERVLHFLGVESAGNVSPGVGLVALSPDSVLLEAGLALGDVLVEADGVRLYAAHDLRPAPSARTMDLRFYRPPSREVFSVRIDLTPLQPPSPIELAPLAAAAALASAFLLGLTGPLGRSLSGIERFARRVGEPGRKPRKLRVVLAGWIPFAFDSRSALAVNLGAFLGVGGLMTAFCFELPALSGRFDLTATFAIAAGGLVAAKVARGGVRNDRWSLRSGLHSGLCGILQILVAGLALAGAGLVHASLSASHVVAEQGPWPWHFSAFSNPGLFVLGMLAFLSALPDGARSGTSLVELSTLGHRPLTAFRSLQPLAVVADRLYLFVIAAMLACVFLGGWQLPAVDLPPLGRQILGAIVFQSKFTLCAAGILAGREFASRTPMDLVAGLAIKRVLPLTATALAGAIAYANWQRGSERAWASELMGPLLVTWCVGLAVTALFQLRRRLAEPATGHAVNPWL